jgi:hypothetical protein
MFKVDLNKHETSISFSVVYKIAIPNNKQVVLNQLYPHGTNWADSI